MGIAFRRLLVETPPPPYAVCLATGDFTVLGTCTGNRECRANLFCLLSESPYSREGCQLTGRQPMQHRVAEQLPADITAVIYVKPVSGLCKD